MADDRRRLTITRLRDNLSFTFPITPFPKFSWGVNDQTQDLLGVGEMDTGHTPKLSVVNIPNIILPHKDNNYNFLLSDCSQSFIINTLWEFLNEQNNLYLDYYEPRFKTLHMYCRLKDMQGVGEVNGNKNIIIESLRFKQYKDNRLNSMDLQTDSQKAIEKYGSDTYYVKDGDNLINIAKKIYGDSSKWNILMNKNGLSNPLEIKVGMGLYI